MSKCIENQELEGRIIIKNYINPIQGNLIITLDKILGWFGYTVKFTGEKIELRHDDSDNNCDYTDFNEFINSWIETLEDAMEDPNVDYIDDIEILKSSIIK